MFYEDEPKGVFFLIDNKSFYASCEAIQLGFNPLKVPLVVLSEAHSTNGGLVLATSPAAKRLFNIKANVSRKRDLPIDKRLWIVPPRMNLYIRKNLQINNIFKEFAAEADVWPYSIDESIIDMSHSWRLFGDTPKDVARVIQKRIRRELGLYTTVGIGDNPVQAKLALDIYAKHNHEFIGEIHYTSVPGKIWPIKKLTDVWGIGERTATKLNRMGIHDMYDLAHSNPHKIKARMGVMGLQLYAISWGVDRSQLRHPPVVRSQSIGNSQVLPKDYRTKEDIETVITEIGQQVGARLRHQKKQAQSISLSIGFSYSAIEDTGCSGFNHSIKINHTNQDSDLTKQLCFLFRKYWEGQSIRNIAVYATNLVSDGVQELDLFSNFDKQIENHKLNQVVDQIRDKYGFTKLVYARSLSKSGTAMERAGLVGGHNGGNSYG